MTQDAYLNYIERFGTDRNRSHCWQTTSVLLNDAFPKLVNGTSMRLKWPTCKKYIAHVMSLCARHGHADFQGNFQQDVSAFLELSTSCGWYVTVSHLLLLFVTGIDGRVPF
jgi:hypothetical protein